jgi:hypothetical protein
MKLSDAIEAGWSNLDQVYGPYFWPEQYLLEGSGYDPARTTRVCALGAASVAVEPESMPGVRVWKRYWPELLLPASEKTTPAMPLSDPLFRSCITVCDFVTFLNDTLRLSKEEVIAQVRAWGL